MAFFFQRRRAALSLVATVSLTASVSEPVSNVVCKTNVSPLGTFTLSAPSKTVGGSLSAASLAGSAAPLAGTVFILPISRLAPSAKQF